MWRGLLASSYSSVKRLLASKGIQLACIALAFFLIAAGGVKLWTASTYEREPRSIASQWHENFAELGIDSVYPPQEDFVVGDIFLRVTNILDETGNQIDNAPFARKAIKLWRVDLRKELDYIYENIPLLPSTKQKGLDLDLEHEASNGLFAISGKRKNMPQVVFPEFTIETTRAASAGANLWQITSLTGSGSVQGAGHTTRVVKIIGSETYGVPYLVASGALQHFCEQKYWSYYCTEEGGRIAISSQIGRQAFEVMKEKDGKPPAYRVGVELTIVMQVYLARSIKVTDGAVQEFSAVLRQTSRQLDEAAEQAETEVSDLKANAVQPMQLQEIQSVLQKAEGRLSSLRAQSAAMKTLLDASEDIGSMRADLQSRDYRGIAVDQVLPRPVAIGFKGVSRVLQPAAPEN